MAFCACGGESFAPVGGEWICQRCGSACGFVRPFFRIRVERDRWFGKARANEPEAVAYRREILCEARELAEHHGGKVIIQTRRRPEQRLAMILGY